MDVDEALTLLGRWSRWQMFFYIILSIVNTFPASWHMLATVFIAGQPEQTHCKLPDGQTVTDYNISRYIPFDKDKDKYHACRMFDPTKSDNSTMDCPNGFQHKGEQGPTIVTEWDLVCDKDGMAETSQTVMVVGVMVGAMGFSVLSDMFGRKPVFLFSEWAMVVVGVSTAFVSNYYVFCVLRFFAGALQQGIILTGFVMACELFPADMRTFAGLAIENFWAIGMCLLALFAYLIRNWHYLQLFISVPMVITVALFWLLPESIPWLVVNDRVKDAEEILKKAAKVNGVHMPDNVLSGPESDHMIKQNDANDAKNKGFFARFKRKKPEKSDEEHAVRYTLLDVLKHSKLRMYAIIMCLLWFVNSLVYYGLSLSTAELAGDRYLNFFLSGLVEIPAYTSAIFILQKWGRRWPLAIFHIIAGLALGITLFIPKENPDLLPLVMTFNMIGKFGITGSFGTVFLYAPEIFPTMLRNQAMGISSVGGRLGNMLAPFSSYVARQVPWLPGILFGALSIGVGLLALLLPETLNRPLPQTIEDIENWSKEAPPKSATEHDSSRPKHELLEMGNDVNA